MERYQICTNSFDKLKIYTSSRFEIHIRWFYGSKEGMNKFTFFADKEIYNQQLKML